LPQRVHEEALAAAVDAGEGHQPVPPERRGFRIEQRVDGPWPVRPGGTVTDRRRRPGRGGQQRLG
jgi:hypothetical protein